MTINEYSAIYNDVAKAFLSKYAKSQKNKNEYLYDPTLADAICDRIIHNSHIVTIKGESMRKLNGVID